MHTMRQYILGILKMRDCQSTTYKSTMCILHFWNSVDKKELIFQTYQIYKFPVLEFKQRGGINLPDLVLHFGLYPRSILLVTKLTGALADGDAVSVVIQGLTLGTGAALSTAGQVLGTDRVVRDDVAGTHALIGTVLVHLASLTWQL